MTEYYVSGCIDNGSEVETCDDSEATFWTLYERDDDGLSQGIIDCTFREDAEAAMRVYQERDALQKQVNALAAEVSGIKYLVMEVSDDDYAQASRRCQLLMGEIANFKTPATDAIKRQWMAEGLEEYGNLTVAIGREQKDLDIDYAGRQALLYAAQLRQPEEKSQ